MRQLPIESHKVFAKNVLVWEERFLWKLVKSFFIANDLII